MRGNMPVVRDWAYFDHAAVGPLPQPCFDAIQGWLLQATQQGDVPWLDWLAGTKRLRQQGAELIRATAEEMALIPNTSTGICMIAEGLDWQEGDNVVFPDNEFPSNGIVWENLARRGVEARGVAVREDGSICLDRLAAAIDSRTRLVSVSWVGFATGYRVGLSALCDVVKSRGALLMLDAIQGMGIYPLDVRATPFDFVVADGHKWMLGPEGAGLMYVREEHLERIQPTVVGWNSVQFSGQFASRALRWKPDASRFEAGSASMVGMLGLGASLNMLLQLGAGQGALMPVVLESAEHLREGLRRIGCRVFGEYNEENRSSIIAFEVPDQDPVEVRQRLMAAGVVVSVRQGKLRASVHAYNDESDQRKMLEGLRLKA